MPAIYTGEQPTIFEKNYQPEGHRFWNSNTARQNGVV